MIQDFRKVVGTERRTTLFDTEWSLRRPNQLAKTSGPTWAFKRALTPQTVRHAACRVFPRRLRLIASGLKTSRCRRQIHPHLAAFQFHYSDAVISGGLIFYARPPRPLESHAASAGRSDTHRTGLLISRHGTLRSFACLRLKQMSPRTSPYRFCTALFKPTGTVFPRCRLTAPSYVADSPSLLLPAPTHSQG